MYNYPFLQHGFNQCVALLFHPLEFVGSVNQNVNSGLEIQDLQDPAYSRKEILFRLLDDHQVNITQFVALIAGN